MERMAEGSPGLRVRIAGLSYLLTIITGAFAAFITGKLVVYGDAASLIATACYIVVTLLFYGLFKPVNGSLSLMAAVFSTRGVRHGSDECPSCGPLHHHSVDPLVFFGCYCLLIGYLIFTSAFLPGILGG